jgi:hypothetical protein
MTGDSSQRPDADSRAPFGTRPRRSTGPLLFFGLLFLAWFAVLFWMAAFEPGS